jgi:VanZ family protein
MLTRWAWMNWPTGARWVLTAAFWGLVNWMLFVPAQTLPRLDFWLPYQDKIAHLAMFGVLAALVRWSIPSSWGRGWRGLVTVLALGVYGAGTEYIQLMSPVAHRMFEVADIVMDCIGIVIGMLLCGRLEKPVVIDGGSDSK